MQSVSLGYLTSASWSYWGPFLLPFAVIGFLLARRIWNSKPMPKMQTAASSAAPAAKTGT